MDIQPFTPAQQAKIAAAGRNPAEFAGYDPIAGEAVTHDSYNSAARGDVATVMESSSPITSALRSGAFKAMGGLTRSLSSASYFPALSALGTKLGLPPVPNPLDFLKKLGDEEIDIGNEFSRRAQAGGKPAQALEIASSAAGGIAPYLINPVAGVATSALSRAGEAGRAAELSGASPTTIGMTELGHAGLSTALDAATMGMGGKLMAPLLNQPMTREGLTKAVGFGAGQGLANTVGGNAVDKVTWDPQRALTEGAGAGTLTGALMGGTVHGVRYAGGERAPTMNAAPQVAPPEAQIQSLLRATRDDPMKFQADMTANKLPFDIARQQYSALPGHTMGPELMEFVNSSPATRVELAKQSPVLKLANSIIEQARLSPSEAGFEATLRKTLNGGEPALTRLIESRVGQLASLDAANLADAMGGGREKAAIAEHQQKFVAQQEADEAARQAAVTAGKKTMAEADAERMDADKALADFYAAQAKTETLINTLTAPSKEQEAAARATEKDRNKLRAGVDKTTLAALEAGPEAAKMIEAGVADAVAQAPKAAALEGTKTLPDIDTKEPVKTALTPEHATTVANAKTAVTTAPTVPKVGKDAALKPVNVANNAAAPEIKAAPSKPAPDGAHKVSVTLEKGTPTSAEPLPPGAWESAVDMDARLAREDAAKINARIAKDSAAYDKELAQAKVKAVAAAAAAHPAIPPNVTELMTQAYKLHAAGKTAEAGALFNRISTALPKTEVVAPAATLPVKPAEVKPITVTAWRGVQKDGPQFTQDGRNFYAEKELVAREYGPVVSNTSLTFEKPLHADNHLDAKKKLRLPSSAPMPDLFTAAEKAGYDGIVWKHHGETEYVTLKPPAATLEVKPAEVKPIVTSAQTVTGPNDPVFQAELNKAAFQSAKQSKPVKVAAPKKVILKSQADPVSADAAALKAAGLEVRPGKNKDTWTLHDPAIDETVRDLGFHGSREEAIGHAARTMREGQQEGKAKVESNLGPAPKGMSAGKGADYSEAGSIFPKSRRTSTPKDSRNVLEKVEDAMATPLIGLRKLRDAGDELAGKAYSGMQNFYRQGSVESTKAQNEYSKVYKEPAKAQALADEILDYEDTYEAPAKHVTIPPELKASVDRILAQDQAVKVKLTQAAIKAGVKIAGRDPISQPYYSPKNLSPEIREKLNTPGTVRDDLIKEFEEWIMDRKGWSKADAEKESAVRFPLTKARTIDSDIEFDPLHKPMTYPLPPGWAGNRLDAMQRFAGKWMTELAKFEHLDKDPVLGPMVQMHREGIDPQTGRTRKADPDSGKPGDSVNSLFRDALDAKAVELNPGRANLMNKGSSLMARGAVQTTATLRDTAMMVPNSIRDTGVGNTVRAIGNVFNEYANLKERGLVRDTGTFSMDKRRLMESFDQSGFLHRVADMSMDASHGMSRLTLTDALNKANAAISGLAGIYKAKSALDAGDAAFFKKIGLDNWQKLSPTEVENFVAKWAQEGSQSSMGAADIAASLLKNQGYTTGLLGPLVKWSYGITNQQIERAWRPALTAKSAKDFLPLLTTVLGGAVAGKVVNELYDWAINKKPQGLTWQEWFAADMPNPVKHFIQKLTDAQVLPLLTNFAAMAAGQKPMQHAMGLDVAPAVGKRVVQFFSEDRSMEQDDAIAAVDQLAQDVFATYRDARKLSTAKDDLAQTEERYNAATKTFADSYMPVNPFSLTKQLNEAKTHDEASAIAWKILRTAGRDTKDPVVKGTTESGDFREFLRKTQPPAEFDRWASKAIEDSDAHDAAKNSTQPSTNLYAYKKQLEKFVKEGLEKKRGELGKPPDTDWRKSIDSQHIAPK